MASLHSKRKRTIKKTHNSQADKAFALRYYSSNGRQTKEVELSVGGNALEGVKPSLWRWLLAFLKWGAVLFGALLFLGIALLGVALPVLD